MIKIIHKNERLCSFFYCKRIDMIEMRIYNNDIKHNQSNIIKNESDNYVFRRKTTKNN